MHTEEYYNKIEQRNKVLRIIEILLRQKWAIMITFLVVVAVVYYYTKKQPYHYSSTSSVIVQPFNISAGAGIQDFSGSAARNLQNELEVLNSKKLRTETARKIIDRFYIDPETQKDTMVIVKRAINLSGTSDPSSSRLLMHIEGYLGIMSSFNVGKEVDIIKITVTSLVPEEAAILANLIAETYYDRDLKRSRSNATQVREFLEVQNEQRKISLEQSEFILQRYMETSGASALGAKSSSIILKITNLESELESNDIEYQKAMLLLENYKNELDRIVPKLTERIIDVDDLYILELQKTIAKAEAERDVSRVISSSDALRPEYAREIARKTRAIDSLKSILSERTESYIDNALTNYTFKDFEGNNTGDLISQLTGEIQHLQLKKSALELGRQTLQSTLKKYEAQFQRLPQQEISLGRITRDKEFNEKLYLKINEQYQEALLAELSTFGRVEILDTATSEGIPVSPKLTENLIIGGILGILFGIFTAFTLNFFFHYVRSPQDVESLGFRLISTIPRIQLESSSSKNPDDSDFKPSTKLLSSKSSQSIALESYQRLQIYLSYGFLDRKIKSLVVSSSGPGEGKSGTASNLAIALANSGKKVLLVDTDMRKPAIHKYFNINPKPALPHFLYKKCSIDAILRNTHVKGLDVVTGIEFARNPSLILTSSRMQEFMDTVNSRYDFVIYDTPPVNAVSDAIHLAKKVDEVILIARADKTNVEELNRANELFEQFHIKIGGIVLNDFDDSKLTSYYGQYYGYYSQERKNGRKSKKRKQEVKNRNIRNRMLLHPERIVSADDSELFPDLEEVEQSDKES